jgi:hypothetical protein
MAQAPYVPFPTAQPYMRPTPPLRINTPGAAFGESIGAALQNLGGSVEKDGNELFQRAMALQELQNENDARQAQTDFVNKIAPMQATFDARTGKDSRDALEPHLDQLNQTRLEYRNQLKTPIAQKLFDQDSLPFYQRNVFASSARAGQQYKDYTVQTLSSQADLAIHDAEDHPDDITFQKSRGLISRTVADAAMVKYGVDENSPIVQDAVRKAQAAHVASQIKGVAHTDPARATQMLDQNKDVLGDQYDALESLVQTRGNAVASANIVNGVVGTHLNPADGTYDATTKAMQEEVRAKAAELYPNNKLLQTEAANALDHRLYMDRFARTNDTTETRNSINDVIAQHPEVTDTQSLLALPGVDKIVGKMSDYDKSTLAQRIFNIQSKQFSEAWRVNNVNAKGLMNSDVQKFLEQDFGTWQLKPEDRAALQNKQVELAKNPKDDPRVSNAMSILHAAFPTQLDAMNVDPKQKSDPQSNYNHFVGSLQEALSEWQLNTGKPAKYEDVIGPIFKQLQTQTMNHHWYWHDTQDYGFKQYVKPTMDQIPPEFRDTVTNKAMKEGKPVPSDTELYRYYLREEYIKLFGASGGGTSTTK